MCVKLSFTLEDERGSTIGYPPTATFIISAHQGAGGERMSQKQSET